MTDDELLGVYRASETQFTGILESAKLEITAQIVEGGPKGEKGEQGIQGIQGEQGPKGDTGDIESLDAQLITDTLGYIPLPISGGILESYSEKLVTLVIDMMGLAIVDASRGNIFKLSLTNFLDGFIIDSVPTDVYSMTLIIEQLATPRAIYWWSGIKWQGGEIPDMTTPNKTYVLTFMTVDGGTNWLGMFGGEF